MKTYTEFLRDLNEFKVGEFMKKYQPLKGVTRALNVKDMVSKKGRSSKLGERSKGHIDPGAASSAMIINTFFEAIENLDNI